VFVYVCVCSVVVSVFNFVYDLEIRPRGDHVLSVYVSTSSI
jgi:hypothetical protein